MLNTRLDKVAQPIVTPLKHQQPFARVSRSSIDDINPDDIIYGEYSGSYDNSRNWIDVIYMDDDIVRTFSGSVSIHHPMIEELKIILRPDDVFYVIPIKEVPLGFAFMHLNIKDIKVSSLIPGNKNCEPSCVWTMYFKDGHKRTIEIGYQAYFAYGNTIRPKSMTNAYILDKVFGQS